MSKKGSAVATFGLNVSGFAQSAKLIINTQRQIAGGFAQIIRTATGVASGIGIARMASMLAGSVSDVVDMAREFDNIKAASGVIASDLQAIRFSSNQRVGFQTARELLGDSGKVWDKYADSIRDASVRWSATSERAQAAWASIIGELSPAFSKILDDFSKFDLIGTAVEFGEKLGNGVKIVYQLLTDGQLLSTLGTHMKSLIAAGVEGLVALGKTGVRVVKLMWESGFGQALNSMWTSWVNFADEAADRFSDALFDTFTDYKEMWNGVLDTGNDIALAVGLGDSKKVAAAKKRRDAEIDDRRRTAAAPWSDSNNGVLNGQFADAMKGMLDELKNNSIGTAPFDDMLSTLNQALEKFNAATVNNPKFDIENRSIGQHYASSSMAGVGGGGPIGVTSMQTMASSLNRQVTIQERIDQKLGIMLELREEKYKFATPVNQIGGVAITNFA